MKKSSEALFVILCLALLSALPDLAGSNPEESDGALIRTWKGFGGRQQEGQAYAIRELSTRDHSRTPVELGDNEGTDHLRPIKRISGEMLRLAEAQSTSQSRKTSQPTSSLDSPLDKQLVDAASKGDLQTVRRLLENGAHIEARDGTLGGTPLIWASFMGHAPVVQLLLKEGANINARNKKAWTALLLSCAKGHVSIAKMLLERDADIDARSSDGWTPLSIAFAKKNATLIKLLAYYCAKSPWATVRVKSVDRNGCLTVRTHPSKSARKVKCIKKGETLGLTGIWTKENWAQVCAPVNGWAFGRSIETRDLPVRKRAVLTVKPKKTRVSPTKRQPKRNRIPVDEPLEKTDDMDLQPKFPVRRHIWH